MLNWKVKGACKSILGEATMVKDWKSGSRSTTARLRYLSTLSDHMSICPQTLKNKFLTLLSAKNVGDLIIKCH